MIGGKKEKKSKCMVTEIEQAYFVKMKKEEKNIYLRGDPLKSWIVQGMGG